MNAIAVVTARGGSKRIPHKNIRPFCGRPMLCYPLTAALQSGLFAAVMVSTDSPEIAAIAQKAGAEVPFLRSEATSGDFASTADVLCEVLEQYAQQGKNFDTVCCLYPTAPFVTAQRLAEAVHLYESAGADSLLPVVRYSFPPQRAMVVRGGALQFQYPEHQFTRSQDLEPIYHDCGQFYLCDTAMLLRTHSLVGARCVPLELPEREVQDIDTPSDWELAEMKYKLLHREESDVPSV